MKVDTKGHTSVIRDTKGDLTAFVAGLTHELNSFENQNIIVDLTAHGHLATADLNLLLPLAKSQKKLKKSFVIVADTAYDSILQKLIVVPTVQEAHDMIEMDEIERDLGF